MENLITGVLGMAGILLVYFIMIRVVFLIIDKVAGDNRWLRRILVALVVMYFIYQPLVGRYPMESYTIVINNTSYVLDPKAAHTIVEIDQWVTIPNYGYVYLNKLDNLNDKEIRLYYRHLGYNMDSPLDFNIELKDGQRYSYFTNGGQQQVGFLLGAGVVNFATNKKIGDNFRLIINDKEILLK